jgi:hypothetical protein
MSRVNPARPDREQLIGALIPAVLPRPTPPPAPLPALPPHREPAEGRLLVDAARVDPSGRVWATTLLRALGWTAGRRVDIDIDRSGLALVVRAVPGGKYAIGTRGGLALPAPQRQMAGIDVGATVILVAVPEADTLCVYPVALLGRLLGQVVGDLHGC